jgi:hypothetical protein
VVIVAVIPVELSRRYVGQLRRYDCAGATRRATIILGARRANVGGRDGVRARTLWTLGCANAAIVVVAMTAVVLGPSTAVGPERGSLQSLLDRAGTDAVPFDPQLAAYSCPVERGPVKEGSDAARYKVSTTPTNASIYYLRHRAKPTTYPRNARIAPVELHTYRLTNTHLRQYKIEADGDIHLVLRDSGGRSMIAEIPYGSCVPTASRWKKAIAASRSNLLSHYRATTSWHYVNRLVTIRGIGYFDPPHGQTGAAPNGIELHPVTGITFATVGGTSSPPASSTPAPAPSTTGAADTCGAPTNPYGYNFCGNGYLIYNPAAGVCNYFNCIASFWNGTGYMAECNDGMYSRSGGLTGACSSHGGEQRPVYSGGGPH